MSAEREATASPYAGKTTQKPPRCEVCNSLNLNSPKIRSLTIQKQVFLGSHAAGLELRQNAWAMQGGQSAPGLERFERYRLIVSIDNPVRTSQA